MWNFVPRLVGFTLGLRIYDFIRMSECKNECFTVKFILTFLHSSAKRESHYYFVSSQVRLSSVSALVLPSPSQFFFTFCTLIDVITVLTKSFTMRIRMIMKCFGNFWENYYLHCKDIRIRITQNNRMATSAASFDPLLEFSSWSIKILQRVQLVVADIDWLVCESVGKCVSGMRVRAAWMVRFLRS